MTYEEALKTLDETVIGKLELKVVLSKAVEKQIPKKPFVKKRVYAEGDFCNTYCCPACKYKLINEDTSGFFAGRKQKYCDCGQALDWSDIE